ncbi:MAG TPA: hypothetical protein VFW40_07080 [Capsulimonadaceae bacterium]|nr:hypothetical protein [Capsulimonadaceae bacterium]
MTKWIVDNSSVLFDNGCFREANEPWLPITYTHPLEAIESMEKSLDGLHGFLWEIQKVDDRKWESDFTELFLSKDPQAVQGYISECLPIYRKSFPRIRSHAFVWYLKSGALVTFHRIKPKAQSTPIEIVTRYLLPWRSDTVESWEGTYDDILADMDVS